MDGCAMFGWIQDPIWKGVERSLKYMNGCAMYMHIIIKNVTPNNTGDQRHITNITGYSMSNMY